MPNIFGRDELDYPHFRQLDRAGLLDSHRSGLRARNSHINFDAMPEHPRNPAMMDANEVTAQALGFLTNNMQAIQAEVDRILYTEFRLNEFFFMNTNIPEGATSYSFKVVDQTGKGKFITQRGTDAGAAGVSMENVPYNLEYGGIFAKWSIDELRNGVFGGIALDTETIDAAVKGAMDHIEEVGISGDVAKGLTGLINNPDIPADTTASTIAAKTADDLVTFLQGEISALIATTNEVIGRNLREGMTIYLPTIQFGDVSNRKLSTQADKSVWQYVSENNQFTQMTGNKVQLRSVIELVDAGAAVTDRMITGMNTPKVMEMGAPIMPRTLTSQNQGFEVHVPVEYKISGLNVKRPTALSYTDGV